MTDRTTTETVFLLLRSALGQDVRLNSAPEWEKVCTLARRQGVAALCLDGLQEIEDRGAGSFGVFDDKPLIHKWYALLLGIENNNAKANARCRELTAILSEAGLRSCILKGQGMAVQYPHPLHRTPGDIDVWVEGGLRKTLDAVKGRWPVSHVRYHHADLRCFKDIGVEMHYRPSWMYNPFHNRKLQAFFEGASVVEFGSELNEKGFRTVSEEFNAVFQLTHIFKHIFAEGMSLKQLTDYFVVLNSDSFTESGRAAAFQIIRKAGLGRFCKAVMWIMEDRFGLDPDKSLCGTDKKLGEVILKSVLEKRLYPLRMALTYPSEGFWILPWKVWHNIWRRLNACN